MSKIYDYVVRFDGQKLLDQYGGDRIFGDRYEVVKQDDRGNMKNSYEVIVSTLGDWCNCPAGVHHGHCKHVGMVYDYKYDLENAMKRVSSLLNA